MKEEQRSVIERLRAQGEKVFTQVTGELMANPHFMKALQGALKGKEMVDQAVAKALKNMNIPTRTEFKRALHRIEALESEVGALKAQAKARRKPAARKPAAEPAPEPAPRNAGAAAPPYMPTE